MRKVAAVGLVLAMAVMARAEEAGPRVKVDLSGEGWVLKVDKEAQWKDETLYAPGTEVKGMEVHPPTAPVGGWEGLMKEGVNVGVPGTVEGYVQKGEGPSGDVNGVSWWTRKVKVPAFEAGQRVLLKVESARQRTEVYVDGKLVGYDLVGNTPFEVDLTGSVKSGEECVLAFRVTDPGGNLDWRDGETITWGKYKLPVSHGFGGITGRVALEVVPPVWVDDVYLQNQPVATAVKAWVTMKNATGGEQVRDLTVVLKEKGGKEVARKELKGVLCPPGERTLPVAFMVPGAALWSVEKPTLYTCTVEEFAPVVKGAVDRVEQDFGFRWFSPEGIGKDATFELNGKRVVLRTAISWGYWPGNGMVPSDEMAERQVKAAKAMGLNMLNFHRAIGQRNVLEKADELGLMYYEEPGGYVSGDGDPFAAALMREKVLRMVKRDRSHPSLVIYSLINEGWTGHGGERDAAVAESRVKMMQEMHQLDPSRTVTHTSAWAKGQGMAVEDRAKMHMRPYDEAVYLSGWYDFHHAGGPEVWQQSLYKGPETYYLKTGNREEIVYWGEEGAISTPPRLEKIKAEIEANGGKVGWDGQVYLDWYKTFDDFITRKGLRSAFPSVEALTVSMGNVSMYHQGRKIETIRLDDVTDGYAINGWEAEVIDDHSGVVDCFRYPKGDPGLIARYNVPVFVAVKSRQEVVNAKGGEATVDFHLVNEVGLKGKMTLRTVLRSPEGKEAWRKEEAVEAKGGEVYGQLLVAGVKVPVGQGASGMYKVEAEVADSLGKVVAKGSEEICAVEWASNSLAGTGAVWEGEAKVRKFLKEKKGKEVAAFEPGMGKVDWLVVARGPEEAPLRAIATEAWQEEVKAAYVGTNGKVIGTRAEKGIGLKLTDGKEAMPGVPVEGFGAKWEGKVMPPVSGAYRFSMKTTGGAKLTVNGKALFDKANDRKFQVNEGVVDLEAGKAAEVVAEFYQRRGDSNVELQWAVPEGKVDIDGILKRVEEGTTLILLDKSDAWMERIAGKVGVTYKGKFEIGLTWLGGIHFVKEHPLFAGLPVNGAMDWPYQAVVREGRLRYALRLEGEELVAGGWHCYPMELGTSVGVIRHGKGKIVVSTLEVANSLGAMGGPEEVGRKLLCNFIDYAGQSR